MKKVQHVRDDVLSVVLIGVLPTAAVSLVEISAGTNLLAFCLQHRVISAKVIKLSGMPSEVK